MTYQQIIDRLSEIESLSWKADGGAKLIELAKEQELLLAAKADIESQMEEQAIDDNNPY